MLNKKLLLLVSLVLIPGSVLAQDLLPADNGLATYHTAPRYRESESHPLRIAAYVVHPVGWLAREVLFRPLSYFASSTEVTRSVMGYREPFDYRQPECFSADDSAPDCRSIMPFNYDNAGTGSSVVGATAEPAALAAEPQRQVYFPDVNYDFNARKLNDLGRGRAHQLAALLKQEPGLKVVLQGNADYKGSDAYNEKLGLDRSEALRQELVSLGVGADRLSTVTFGETQPALPEQEDWARAVNRRVEVHVEAPAAN
jgi:outer membrane protein OmpA-like peptidoglycan-associated protein